MKVAVPVMITLVILGWLIIPALRQVPAQVPTEQKELAALTLADIAEVIEDPDSFAGRAVEIDGQIAKDPEYGRQGTYLQVHVVSGKQAADVIARYPDHIEVTQGDFVRVIGSVAGLFSGETSDGERIETVRIDAESIEPVVAEAALAPAHATWDRVVEKQVMNLFVRVDKIEFAASETRLYMSAHNAGDNPLVIQVSNSFLKQGGKLYEPRTNLPPGYKEVPIDLSEGSSGAGVLVFPPLSEKEPLDFSLMVSGPGGEKGLDFAFRP